MLSKLIPLATSFFSSSWFTAILCAGAAASVFFFGYQVADTVWEIRWAAEQVRLTEAHRVQIEEVRKSEHDAIAQAEDVAAGLRKSLIDVQKRYEDLVADLDRLDHGDAERVPERFPVSASSPDPVPATAAPAGGGPHPPTGPLFPRGGPAPLPIGGGDCRLPRRPLPARGAGGGSGRAD